MKINVIGGDEVNTLVLPKARYFNLYSKNTSSCCVSVAEDEKDARRTRTSGLPGVIIKIEPTVTGDFNITIVQEFK